MLGNLGATIKFGSTGHVQVKSVDETMKDSVAFTIISNAFKNREINESEKEYLEIVYKNLYQNFRDFKDKEVGLTKRLKATMNDVLSESIALEKALVVEADETQKLHRVEELRDNAQADLTVFEHRDTVAKFELAEMRRTHEELFTALSNMKKENIDLVEPVLKKLRDDIENLYSDVKSIEENVVREAAHKNNLQATLTELEAAFQEKASDEKSKTDILAVAEIEPTRIARQTEAVEKAVHNMEAELKLVQQKIKNVEMEIEKKQKRKVESENVRKSLQEKLESNRQTIETRENEVALVRGKLDLVKARNHDLITQKLELTMKKKDIDNETRHQSDQLKLLNKEYDLLKRQLKTKRGNVANVKVSIPSLEATLASNEVMLKSYEDEREEKQKLLKALKVDIDSRLAQFMQQEDVEEKKQKELTDSLGTLDELETEVLEVIAVSKRQSKLISVLSAQRDIKIRDSSRIEQKHNEARQYVRIKEVATLDLTKRCNEISNRLKEFSALYEVVKNERNKYVNLIQSSTQALAEMREKIRILNNEVEILGNESAAKDLSLTKESSAHIQAQNQRDSLRQDMNRLLLEYRQKQGLVERQIQEIDKLNISINALEKEMLELKKRYEHSVEERNLTGVKLIDRNDELCVVYERLNQQTERLKVAEVQLKKRDTEFRMVRLQTEELKRQYSNARARLSEVDHNRVKIEALEEQLVVERKRTMDLGVQLENPQHSDRWRSLEGEDPDGEQLDGRIKVLEQRLDLKRAQRLEKELVVEEISALTEKLRSQAHSKRESAKVLADQVNELQARLKDVTKKMLATVSELSMYQATALRLQEEQIEKAKSLELSTWRADHGEPPSEESLLELERQRRKKRLSLEAGARAQEEMLMNQPGDVVKTAAEPRPTAYIPDDLGIPKPYGSLAPFKPTEGGSTMRHIKMPQPKPIEI